MSASSTEEKGCWYSFNRAKQSYGPGKYKIKARKTTEGFLKLFLLVTLSNVIDTK